MSGLSAITWIFFAGWVGAFLVFYFLYGIKHSNLEPYPKGDEQ